MCTQCSCCSACCKFEEESLVDLDMVEDGDVVRNVEMNRTFELLRTMMNQHGRPVVDQPPPAYADFNKYPLTSESEDKPELSSAWTVGVPSKLYPRPVHTRTERAVTSASQQNTWMEPFPKPSGEPPPVPPNWFLTRLASIRQSLLTHFAYVGSIRRPVTIQPSTSVTNVEVQNNSEPTTESSQTVRTHTSECRLNEIQPPPSYSCTESTSSMQLKHGSETSYQSSSPTAVNVSRLSFSGNNPSVLSQDARSPDRRRISQ
ncbi:hypothetical protein P879_04183 [Paragonimus westermani]|uniref:Uncharacterized protein n=1 Tax=Paragonimus westermani TaxID=34504 RepID=A0A8T0D8U1_9TREM|nr:hypothetical protein P879_04183 [Paragonimus westermani]